MSLDPQTTSLTLLNLLRTEDSDGWRRFTAEYGPIVYTWCRKRGVDETSASDISQEVFIAVLRNISAFRKEQQEDTFRGWLWMITQYKIRDYFRGLARGPRATGGSTAQNMLGDIIEDPSLSPSAVLSERESQLTVALQTVQVEVESRTWTAFWRTCVDGIDTATAAQELEMSAGAIRVNRFRVLKRLREELTSLTLHNSNPVLDSANDS